MLNDYGKENWWGASQLCNKLTDQQIQDLLTVAAETPVTITRRSDEWVEFDMSLYCSVISNKFSAKHIGNIFYDFDDAYASEYLSEDELLSRIRARAIEIRNSR